MLNFNDEINKYYFHDSQIDFVSIQPGDGLLRNLKIDINYYNWEGNKENQGEWKWKRLILTVEHCFLLRFEFPDLIEGGFEISHVELKNDYESIQKFLKEKKPKIYYNVLKNKEFKNWLSVKFYTHDCYGDPIYGETTGYLWIAGFDAKIELNDSDITGQIHIPVNNQ